MWQSSLLAAYLLPSLLQPIFFLIDKKGNILKRAAKKAAQGIQKVYSYHQPPPQKHQYTKKEIQPARPHQ